MFVQLSMQDTLCETGINATNLYQFYLIYAKICHSLLTGYFALTKFCYSKGAHHV